MSPLAGRFLGRDPIGFEGSQWGLFEFLDGEPFRYVDPFGTAKSNGDICRDVAAKFRSQNIAEFDRLCGKGKYHYPFGFDIICAENSNNGQFDKICNSDGGIKALSYCHNATFWGDKVGIVVCADNRKGNEDELKSHFETSLRNEFVKSLDYCTCNNNCKHSYADLTDPKQLADFCEYASCTEIRAWSYANCRNVPAADFEKCVRDGAFGSLNGRCPKKTFDAVYNKCVIKQGQPIGYPPPVQ